MTAPDSIREVLVVKPSSLGDVIHTLPAVAALKQARPAWRISWLINTELAPLLEGNPDVASVVIFPRQELRARGWRGWPSWVGWGWRLRRLRPGLALDFQGLFRSALVARLSGARRLHGLADAREGARWFFDRVVAVPPGVHAADRYLALVRDLGVEPGAERLFRLPDGVRPPGVPDGYVLVHPFARGAGKSLTPEALDRLCAGLGDRPVVVAGRQAAPAALPRGSVDLVNRTTLPELIWLIRHAAWTVSVDSGPMHIAAALSGRLLSIHTWSDPRLVGPCHPQAWVWKAGEILRVSELSAGRQWPESSFQPADARAVADFVRQQTAGVSS
jgi:heptosyltransferase I